MWLSPLGIVTRCPLVLKLKQLKQGEKWRGKVIYKDNEIEISHPSLVEREINKGMYMHTLLLILHREPP